MDVIAKLVLSGTQQEVSLLNIIGIDNILHCYMVKSLFVYLQVWDVQKGVVKIVNSLSVGILSWKRFS